MVLAKIKQEIHIWKNEKFNNKKWKIYLTAMEKWIIMRSKNSKKPTIIYLAALNFQINQKVKVSSGIHLMEVKAKW